MTSDDGTRSVVAVGRSSRSVGRCGRSVVVEWCALVLESARTPYRATIQRIHASRRLDRGWLNLTPKYLFIILYVHIILRY